MTEKYYDILLSHAQRWLTANQNLGRMDTNDYKLVDQLTQALREILSNNENLRN